MAEEPQPAGVHEGATEDAPAPASGEERKTAAALSTLDARDDDDAAPKKDVDTAALGEAMKNLDVGEEPQKEAKKVKIEAADVALVMSELLLSKVKATDLLKAHDGDAVQAMVAHVTAPVS